MQGSINKLDFNIKIGTFKITANFSTPLDVLKIPKHEKIQEIIKKEFNHDFDLWENARLILSNLQPFCYEVLISPQLQGCKYSYTVTVKK